MFFVVGFSILLKNKREIYAYKSFSGHYDYYDYFYGQIKNFWINKSFDLVIIKMAHRKANVKIVGNSDNNSSFLGAFLSWAM